MSSHAAHSFLNFCRSLLEVSGYRVLAIEGQIGHQRYDYIATSPSGDQTVIEVKFYSSSRIPLALFRQAFSRLHDVMRKTGVQRGLIIASAEISDVAIESVTGTSIEVWNNSIIRKKLINHPELLEKFEAILREGQVFRRPESTNSVPINNSETPSIYIRQSPEEASSHLGAQLCKELHSIPSGHTHFSKFENKCIEILKYIFDEDLTSWRTQNSTEKKLHRFDLIARVSSAKDFWSAIYLHHRTRYVIFEFKNYSSKIGQTEIYSTEKYLYPNAMRSTAIIISKNGYDKNAYEAAKGALREAGKVILILTAEHLCRMLYAKDNAEDPSDILVEILDDMLMTIER